VAACIGIVVLTVLAIGWLTVASGLAAKTPESAGIAGVPLMLLPFLSSAFVPADTMGRVRGNSPSTSRSPRSSKPRAGC
jgi:hypothetical protein